MKGIHEVSDSSKIRPISRVMGKKSSKNEFDSVGKGAKHLSNQELLSLEVSLGFGVLKRLAANETFPKNHPDRPKFCRNDLVFRELSEDL